MAEATHADVCSGYSWAYPAKPLGSHAKRRNGRSTSWLSPSVRSGMTQDLWERAMLAKTLVMPCFAGMARSHEAVTLRFLPVHRNAGGVAFLHRAVVAEERQREEFFFQRRSLAQAEVDQRRRLVIKHHEVRFLARLQVADPVVQVERAGAAQGGQVQRLERVELLALQLHHLVRLVQRLQLGKTGARADVGAQANPHTIAFHFFQVE